jgi:hypothetical protein
LLPAALVFEVARQFIGNTMMHLSPSFFLTFVVPRVCCSAVRTESTHRFKQNTKEEALAYFFRSKLQVKSGKLSFKPNIELPVQVSDTTKDAYKSIVRSKEKFLNTRVEKLN